MKDEWKHISTHDKAPGERILCIDTFDNWVYIGVFIESWGDEGLYQEEDGSMPDHQPDYWMPLPSPPKT